MFSFRNFSLTKRNMAPFCRCATYIDPCVMGLFVDFVLGGEKGVLHQRADGHGAYATWHWGDKAAQGSHFVEVHVAVELKSALCGGGGQTGGAHIYHHCAFFHHVGLHEVRLSDGGDEDVGTAALARQVFGGAVAHGHGAVAWVVFLKEHLCHGLAHDVASAEHHAVLAAGFDAVALEQRENALRCGGAEAGQTYRHAAHVDGVEAVHIFPVVDGLNHFLLVDVARERKLHDEAVDIGVGVELCDSLQQLLLAHAVLESDERGLESALGASLHFVCHVGFAAAVVTHKNGGEVGLLFAFGNHFPHLLGNFLFDFHCRFFSVDNYHVCMKFPLFIKYIVR